MCTFNNWEQYLIISKDQFTISRFLGFVQTDGHISFGFDSRDNCFRPRITITANAKNMLFARQVLQPFFQEKGILIVFNKRSQKSGDTCNLIIERQGNVLNLINLIENELGDLPMILVDDKLFQYNSLKKAFELNSLRVTTYSTQKQQVIRQLIDLKVGTMRVNKQKRNGIVSQIDEHKNELTRRNLESQFQVFNSKGSASQIVQDLKDQTNTQCELFLNYLKTNNLKCLNSSRVLKDYFFSILEGDGSFQVCFLTKQSKDKNTTIFNTFEVLVTITDGCVNSTKKHFLLETSKLFFENETNINTSGANANRLYIKSLTRLRNIVTFVKSQKFLNQNDAKRFAFFEFCVENYDEIHRNRQLALLLVQKLSIFGEEKFFQHSTVERIHLLNLYFDSL